MENKRERVKPDKGEWPYVIFGIILFFGTIFLYALELPKFSYSIQFGQFILLAIAIGIISGILLSWHFGKNAKGEEKMKLTALLIFVMVATAPLYLHMINRFVPIGNQKEVQAELFKNEAFHEGLLIASEKTLIKSGFYIHLLYQKKLKRLFTHNPYFLETKEGEQINFTIQRGILGYQFIDKNSFGKK